MNYRKTRRGTAFWGVVEKSIFGIAGRKMSLKLFFKSQLTARTLLAADRFLQGLFELEFRYFCIRSISYVTCQKAFLNICAKSVPTHRKRPRLSQIVRPPNSHPVPSPAGGAARGARGRSGRRRAPLLAPTCVASIQRTLLEAC